MRAVLPLACVRSTVRKTNQASNSGLGLILHPRRLGSYSPHNVRSPIG